jgi:Flp pilus assembly protein TadG
LFFDGKLELHRSETLDAQAGGALLRNRARRGERGEGRLKTVLFLLFFASAIFIGFKTLPAYVAEYQLADKMQETARFAVVQRQSEEQIRETIFKVIQDLNIPCKKEDIKVTTNASAVTISVDYRVPVDLIIYQTELHFTPSSENKSLV